MAAAATGSGDAAAAASPQQQLASRYSPVVDLKKQRTLCGKGEAYRPVQVDLVLGRKDVSLFEGAGRNYRRLRRAPTTAGLASAPAPSSVELPRHPRRPTTTSISPDTGARAAAATSGGSSASGPRHRTPSTRTSQPSASSP